MSLEIPETSKEIVDQLKNDTKAELKESNPFSLRNHFIVAILTGLGLTIYEAYLKLKAAIVDFFWDTCSYEILLRWARIFGITPNPASKAKGYAVFVGTPSTGVAAGTQIQNQGGVLYRTTQSGIIQSNELGIKSAVVTGTRVTIETFSEHQLASGMEITIAGVLNNDVFNGTHTITVINEAKFYYDLEEEPAIAGVFTNAVVQFSAVYIPVESVSTGASTNAQSGETLELSNAIAGVNQTVYVPYAGISGGSDAEGEISFRNRFLDRVRNPIGLWNKAYIEQLVKTIAGVTRVFIIGTDDRVKTLGITSIVRTGNFALVTFAEDHYLEDGSGIDISGAEQNNYNGLKIVLTRGLAPNQAVFVVEGNVATPATGDISASMSITYAGQVRVLFTRDNDIDIVPRASAIEQVKTLLVANKPVFVSEHNVIVGAPIVKTVDFNFNSVVPNTVEMREAVSINLKNFFTENTALGKNITQQMYDSAIKSTVDTFGNQISTYTLNPIVGDITAAENELIALGSITFNG